MGSLPAGQRIKADTVCIIGAGPSGLAAAKYLQAERAFSRIQIYEQRSTVGGIWNYVPTSSTNTAHNLAIPQTNPFSDVDKPVWQSSGAEHALAGKKKEGAAFMSPMYDRLETNIPRGLMGFNELDWREDCQLFPQHEEVLRYIERYAKEVQHLIEFERQILEVQLQPDGKWLVRSQEVSRDDTSPAIREEMFDAIASANGHFNIPYLPTVPGIQDFNTAHPGLITHSKFYRRPEDFTNEKVIVIGNSASGIDIGAQIATTCAHPLIISSRSESYLNPDPTPSDSRTLQKPEITAYLPASRGVRFADGTTEENIDAIVYCTGYFYSFPFFPSSSAPGPDLPPLISTGERVQNTYQHLFYAPAPTLAFPVLGQKVIPFPMAEAQAAVMARVWSGRLSLPNLPDMADWESREIDRKGDGRGFHVLKFPEDGEYINMMYEWARSADGEGSGGVGKVPPCWGEEAFWARERFPAIKKAFQGFGEDRHRKRRLEDVGFDFAAWKRGREVEGVMGDGI
ncbi:hypothetical protein MBLNU230_g5570t1 [Neophaeotheca triangularis]